MLIKFKGNKMINVLGLIFVLIISVDSVSAECKKYDFPCEDGGCVDSALWCDSHKDCSDGSDEKYCQVSTFFNSDPNKCPSTYFKCKNGHCIPSVGRCDGYENCNDKSDEKECGKEVKTANGDDASPNANSEAQTTATTASKSKKHKTTTPSSKVKFEESHSADHFQENQDSSEVVFSELDSLDDSRQLKNARNWLLQQRKSDFGWGDETPRAITALFLSSGQHSILRNESDFLMVKQLEVQLALNLARNGTRPMKLSNLALYINALMATCKDPRNFYGDDLIRLLRNGVDAATRVSTFVNPCVYLTLCLNNASTYEDAAKIQTIQFSSNAAINRMDVQALALLTSACHHRNKHIPSAAFDDLEKRFLYKFNANTRPGNVYEAALLMQALLELNGNQTGLLSSILQKQQVDGSFGGILATYLVLPVLAGKNFLQINEHCSHNYTTDPAPIEVLKNMKRRKITVKYSLRIGYPVETTETIEMQVAEGVSFLNVMRLAQEINPKFRFMLDGNRGIPVVYSIGGIPNDAEKGLFWNLYLSSIRNRVASDGERLVPLSGNIKTLIPHPGDEYIFWIRSL